MTWSSPCEFTPGCVIAAASEIDVTGFAGTLQFAGGELSLNGAPLPWLGGPPQTMFVSGPPAFTVSGLLGLGFTVRRRGG